MPTCDDDQIVPYADSGRFRQARENGTLRGHTGIPARHATIQAATINADMLAFLKS